MENRIDRRRVVVLVAAAGAALALPRWARSDEGKEAPKKRLLILGGTRFLGPALVEAALREGYAITLFNRGKSNPGLFKDRPGIEEIQGDRNVAEDLARLSGKKWDAVVDTSGYFPRQVRAAAKVLAGNVGQYVFISSISVYEIPMKAGSDERAPVARLEKGTDVDAIDKISETNYGPLKALCEEEAETAFPGKALRIRPGFIVGLRDGSDRFTYWPVRVEKGGEVLAPGRPADPVQFIDVRDLGDWTVRMVLGGRNGIFNATGPKERLGMGALLESCRKVTGSNATFRWVDEKTMEELGLDPGGDFPIWASPSSPDGGLGDVSIARALAAGLSFRPLETTIRDTIAWWKTLPEPRRLEMRAGLAAEKEAAALAKLKAKREAGKSAP